jgi:peptide chain release factor 2
MAELSRLSEDVTLYDRIAQRAADARVLWDLARSEDDEATAGEVLQEIQTLERDIDSLEVTSLLGGEFDDAPAILEVHAGEGGTDSQDWAEMLLRMYLRWAERHGEKTELLEVTPGEEAGIKSGS